MPRHLSPFTHRPKSTRITRRRYPEEWAWWAASYWQMMVEDEAEGRASLHSCKDNRAGMTVWGARATPEQIASPAEVRYWLTVALYFHLHPIKARRHIEQTGQVCTGEELAAFIRQQRRKAA